MMSAAYNNGLATAKRNLIIGLGKTGLSVAQYFAREGIEFSVADTREQPPQLFELNRLSTDIETRLGALDADWLSGFDRIVVSPGIDLRTPAIKKVISQGVQVIGDVQLFADIANAPIIAITGSNGKSTVTTLVGELLAASNKQVVVGGNLGTPVLNLFADDAPDVYVLELSSFQLESTHQLNAQAAVVLNVSADHMDRYDDFTAYAKAKARLLAQTQIAVLNKDDARVMAMDFPKQVNTRTFSIEVAADYCLNNDGANAVLQHGDLQIIDVASIRMQGKHNWANALAALALLEEFNLPNEVVSKVLNRFSGLAHRTQWVAEKNGVVFINDSKATNIGATQAALMGMTSKSVVILGGQGKDQDFNDLRDSVKAFARAVVLMGEDAEKIEASLQNLVPMMRVNTMQDAVITAMNHAQASDVVLLSPACASFDMYSGFSERGDDFMRCVQEVVHDRFG